MAPSPENCKGGQLGGGSAAEAADGRTTAYSARVAVRCGKLTQEAAIG